MLDNGYIKAYRSFTKWEWYTDANTMRVFFHLLLTVNYEPQKWRGIDIGVGQRISSYGKLAEELKLSVKQIRTAIKHLIQTGEVAHNATSEYGIFTVINYMKFQQAAYGQADEGHTAGTQGAVKGQQRKKANNTNNEKEEKEIQRSAAWVDFVSMRKTIKKPLTPRAIEMALSELEKLAPDNLPLQEQILNQSTYHCWQGLFPLNDESKQKTEKPKESRWKDLD